jgi:hypothetical protein
MKRNNVYKLNTINIFDITFLLLLYLKLTNQIQIEWVYVFIPFIISCIGAFFIAAIAKNATNNENKN